MHEYSYDDTKNQLLMTYEYQKLNYHGSALERYNLTLNKLRPMLLLFPGKVKSSLMLNR